MPTLVSNKTSQDPGHDTGCTEEKKGLVHRAIRCFKQHISDSMKKTFLKFRQLNKQQCSSTSPNGSDNDTVSDEVDRGVVNELQETLLDCDGEVQNLRHPSTNPTVQCGCRYPSTNVRTASSDSGQGRGDPVVRSARWSYFPSFSSISNLEADISRVLSTDYKIMATKTIGQITLFVCVLVRHVERIRSIRVMRKGTGPGGYVNKGAVGVVLDFDGTTLCFVNSHLPAHEGEKYRNARNADVRRIMRSFERQCPDRNGTVFSERFDHLFWFGDLNYRLNFSCKDWSQSDRFNYACSMIRTQAWQELLKYDELRCEIKSRRTFAGFSEGDITFAPTFKVLRGSRCVQYNPQRVPAFCDRVLYKSSPMPGSAIRNTEYGVVESMNTSDHKPVFCNFHVVVPSSRVSE